MSLTPIAGHPGFPDHNEPRHKITTASLREQKLRHEPITCLTAYDYATARIVDEAAIDMILVGDSLAQTMLGYENTLSVTMDESCWRICPTVLIRSTPTMRFATLPAL